MKFFTLPALLASALFSTTVVVPFLPAVRTKVGAFALETQVASNFAGHIQIYYDLGQGLSEHDSSMLPLAQSDAPLLYRLPLPPGDYRALRFDVIDRAGRVTVAAPLRIVSRTGRLLKTIPLDQLQPSNEIVSVRMLGNGLEIQTTAGATDPQLSIPFPAVLPVHALLSEDLYGWWPRAGGVFLALALLLGALEITPRASVRAAEAARRVAQSPSRAIAIVAAIAVALSAYPVIFLGKSYVAPNFGTSLLYDGFPALPGYSDKEFVNSQGSDVGAIMWQHVPYSMIQRRALLEGELPLWNRYNSGGAPLLGQGQSMFGDPLQLIVVLCNGASWAWDTKFLIAKWLFATGLALIIFALTRQLAAALLVALAAPFIGFFVYRINHPAIFSICYAPWPLYCWIRIAQAAGRRSVGGWIAGLIVANCALMNSGTVKEAYMLLLTMNFSGAIALLNGPTPWRSRLLRFCGVAWAGLIFALLTSPVWGTFLHTLQNARTNYDAGRAYQIQPSLLLGFFDEAFYRPLTVGNFVFDPSLNFLLLLGLLYFLVTLRTHLTDRLVTALALSSFVPLALAFGLVPAAWIVRLPFLANVAHIDNCFSCGLIVLWSVLAGVGFAQAVRRLGSNEGRSDLALGALLLFGLVFAWISFHQTVHRSIFGEVNKTFSAVPDGRPVTIQPFVWYYLGVLLFASVLLVWLARRALMGKNFGPGAAILVSLCVMLMLWRQGLQAPNVGFEDYVVRPPTRVDFHAQSKAVDYLRAAQAREPARSFGLHWNFFPGWSGVYSLESINGPDALMNPWYRDVVAGMANAHGWDWVIHLEPQTVGPFRRLLDALNVRYYVDLPSAESAPEAPVKLVEHADLAVYESPDAWPRAFFTDRVWQYDDVAQFIGQVTAGDGRPFAAALRTDIASSAGLGILLPNLASRTVTPATNYRLTENTTAFTVHANGAGVALLTETLWPGDFRAELDGRKVPILRLNHTFKGVMIEAAGDHRIVFRYVPKNFPRNLAFSFTGLLLGLCSLGWCVWPKSR